MKWKTHLIGLSLAILLILFLSGCSNDEQKPTIYEKKPLEKNNIKLGTPINFAQLSEVFMQPVEVVCNYVDETGNEGILYGKNMSYRIETVQPDVGKLITFYQNNMLYTVGASQQQGTIINLTAINLKLNKKSNTPILALDGLQHTCYQRSIPEELFIIPQKVIFKDITNQFKKPAETNTGSN